MMCKGENVILCQRTTTVDFHSFRFADDNAEREFAGLAAAAKRFGLMSGMVVTQAVRHSRLRWM